MSFSIILIIVASLAATSAVLLEKSGSDGRGLRNAMIGLLLLAGVASLIKDLSGNTAEDYLRQTTTELLRLVDPPKSFAQALAPALGQVVLEHNLVPIINGKAQNFPYDFEAYVHRKAVVVLLGDSGQPADQTSLSRVLVINEEDRANFFTEYVGRGDMKCAISRTYFGEVCLPHYPEIRKWLARQWRPSTDVSNADYFIDHLCLLAREVAPFVQYLGVFISLSSESAMRTSTDFMAKPLAMGRSCELAPEARDDSALDAGPTNSGSTGHRHRDSDDGGTKDFTLDEAHVLLFKSKIPARAYAAAYSAFLEQAKNSPGSQKTGPQERARTVTRGRHL